WIRSEPLDTELGGDRTKTLAGLQLSYYGIDDDVIDTYAASGNDTRPFLQKEAEGHTSTGHAFALRIFPTRRPAGPHRRAGAADADIQAAGGRRPADARDATRASGPVLLVREHDGRIRLPDRRRRERLLGPHDRVQGRGRCEGESPGGTPRDPRCVLLGLAHL